MVIVHDDGWLLCNIDHDNMKTVLLVYGKQCKIPHF